MPGKWTVTAAPPKTYDEGWKVTAQPKQLGQQEESIPGAALRHTARTGARVAETVAGLPGDIASLGIGLGDIASQKLLGKPFLPGAQEWLPTSHKIRKKITEPLEEKFLPEFYLTPHTKGESLSDEFFSDLASLTVPIPFLSSGKITKNALKGALGTAGAGNFAKFAAQKLGAEEGTQNTVKLGTMLLSSLGGLRNTKVYMDSLYHQAADLMPKGTKVSIEGLKKTVENIGEINFRGATTPSKEAVTKPLKELKKKIKTHKGLPIEEAVEFKKNFNELIREGDLPSTAEGQLKSLVKEINKSINTIGKSHPEFLKTLRAADDVWAGLYQGSKVSKFLKRHVKLDEFASPLTLAVLGLVKFSSKIPKIAGAIGGALGAKRVFGGLEALWRSNEIKKFYAKTIYASLKGNVALASKYARLLDDAIREEE